MGKGIALIGVACAFAAVSGCTTTRSTTVSRASSAATASTETVAVSVSTESATVTRSTTPPPPPAPPVDVLSGAKRPCGTVAADAPRFIGNETEK